MLRESELLKAKGHLTFSINSTTGNKTCEDGDTRIQKEIESVQHIYSP